MPQFHQAAIPVDPGILWVELDRFIIVLQRIVILAEKRVSVGAVTIGFRILWIQLDCGRVIFDCEIIVAETSLGKGAVVIELRLFWVQPLRFIEIGNRLSN